jgi:hypothetical protein
MVLAVLGFDFLRRLFNLGRFASGRSAPLVGTGSGLLSDFTQWNGQLLTSPQLLFDCLGLKGIVEVEVVLGNLFALFVCDRFAGIEGLEEGC